jgi:hypothetical protein
MPQYINITLENTSVNQYVFDATDNALHKPILSGVPLGPGESTAAKLLVGPDNYGHITYGYLGGVPTTRDDVMDGEHISMA